MSDVEKRISKDFSSTMLLKFVLFHRIPLIAVAVAAGSTIHYDCVGRCSNIPLKEIKYFVEQDHPSINTIAYLFNNNCQDYAKSIIKYLSLAYPCVDCNIRFASNPGVLQLDAVSLGQRACQHGHRGGNI